MSYIINKELLDKNTKFYTYLHRTKDGTPFYVGKGKNMRCTDSKQRSKWWNNIVNKYGYYVEILDINLDEEECFQREVFWISHYGRKQLGGTLINLTNGGEGCAGLIWTENMRLQKSKYFKENLEILQNIGNRHLYFGKSLKGSSNPNFGNKYSKNKLSKPVVQLDLKGNLIQEFSSCTEAEETLSVIGVYQVCRFKRHQLRGFIFRYKEDYEKGILNISEGVTSKKSVAKIDLNTNEVLKVYNSINETSVDGFNPKNVSQVCCGEKKSHKGFFWKKIDKI